MLTTTTAAAPLPDPDPRHAHARSSEARNAQRALRASARIVFAAIDGRTGRLLDRRQG